jgi:hypothetical protein
LHSPAGGPSSEDGIIMVIKQQSVNILDKIRDAKPKSFQFYDHVAAELCFCTAKILLIIGVLICCSGKS